MDCHPDQRNWQVLIVVVNAAAAMLFSPDAEHGDSCGDSLDNTGFHLRAASQPLMYCAFNQAIMAERLVTRIMSIRTKAGSYHLSDQ